MFYTVKKLLKLRSQATFATKRGVDRLNQQQDDQARITILDWLTPIDYAPQQVDFIHRREPGTGQRLLNSPEFQTWLKADNQTLFCPGIPGSGKTILASVVIDELMTRFGNDEAFGIAYIYFNFKREHEQKVEDVIASLLKQLAQCKCSLPESMKLLYDRHKKQRTRPSLDEISSALQSVATLYSRVFIVIDALDECQIVNGNRKRFLSALFNLQAKCGVNIFAMSRSILEIEKCFEGCTSLEIRATEEDVRRYLDRHIPQLPGSVFQSEELQEKIKTAIVKAVDGM